MRTETFPTARQLGISVKLPRGDVEVETADVQETTVTMTADTDRARRQIEETVIRLDDRGDRDELVIDSDPDDFAWGSERRIKVAISFSGRRDKVHVRVVAPHGTDLTVATGAADLRANGRFGEVETKTGSGDITIGEVERDAQIKVASGDIEIDRVGGSLKVQTAAGDLRAGPVGGSAEVKTAAGDVSLAEVGYDVAVTSASGDLHVGSVTQGKVALKSVSGDMVVGVRRGSRVWMDVKTVTGNAQSELDSDSGDDGEGPLVELKATAMSGDIKIVRA
jgi:DUF4097 and DUF4098 domain-containing protein YvlB